MTSRVWLLAAGALFVAPTARAEPAATDEVLPAPAPADALEVTVVGERPAPGVESLSRQEVRQLPGAFGDPFRAIEALPGVTPIASGIPFFYVRGAPPGNVGYFLDGIRVPYLFHIGLGPSVVHPAIVERVDLYSGGYPARYGRFAGGIVAGETTEPRTDFHGEGNVRIFDIGAVAEGGFAGDRGTILVGGRYSYTAAILSLVQSDVELDYRDYQARITYDLGARDRVSVFTFGAYDLLGEPKQRGLDLAFASEFYRVDVRHDHAFGDSTDLRTAVTLGFEQTPIAEFRNGQNRMVAPRIELVHRASDDVTVRAGADVAIDDYGSSELAYEDPDNPELAKKNALFPQRTDVAVGGTTEVLLVVTPEVEITPGARVDLFTSRRAAAVGVDPRLAARFRVSDDVRIVHAYGLAHQAPSFIAPIPGIAPGTLAQGLQKSFQTSAGVEVDLPEDLTATTTLFHNAFFDMTDTLATSEAALAEPDFTSSERSRGDAFGVEVLVRRSFTKKLAGFLAYTLSRSVRVIGRDRFPSAFDRTHVANAAISYDLGRRWRAGSRVVFYTGTPESSPANGLIVARRSAAPDRSPPFYRVDVRLEKRWPIGRRGFISFVAEVLNTTLSKETFGSSTGPSQTIGPITIPSIGAEVGF